MRTLLFDTHVALGARMAPFGGWDMPIQYEGILAEHAATRTTATVFDTCHMGEFELRGATALDDLERLLTMNVRDLDIGRCRYGYLLKDDGGVIDDLTCYRFGPDHFWLIVNAGTLDGDAAWIRRHLSDTTEFTDLSPATGKLDIQGPQAKELTETALGVSLPPLGYFTFTPMSIGGVECVVSRTGYTGEFGYELYVPAAHTVDFWQRLTAAGIAPAGLGARDTLRLEMGYPLYGHELDETRTPVAAARGAFLDRAKDFIGKPACERDLANGCLRYLCGLVLDGRRAARAHDIVKKDGVTVGEITSGSLAPSLGVAVAMAYLDAALCATGTTVEVEVHGKALPAKVEPLPLYKNGTARRKAR